MNRIVQFNVSRDDDVHTAEGGNVPVATQAHTFQELKNNIREAVKRPNRGLFWPTIQISVLSPPLRNREKDIERSGGAVLDDAPRSISGRRRQHKLAVHRSLAEQFVHATGLT